MRLALGPAVLDLMGLRERVGSSSTADTALEQATSQIETHLGTSLQRQEIIDYFSFTRNFGSTSQPRYVLNLSRGFIDKLQPFAVYTSSDGLAITSISGSNATLQVSTVYGVEWEKGRVTLRGTLPTWASDRIIAVHYTSGFVADAEGMAQGVPDFLAQGAIALAARVTRSFAGTPIKSAQMQQYQSEMKRMATAILSNYIKLRSYGSDPDVSDLL